MYRSQSGGKSGQPVNVFLQEFHENIDSHASSKGKLLLVEDFKRYLESNSSNEANSFKELMFRLNIPRHVTTPTYGHSHTLDHVSTNLSFSLNHCTCSNSCGCDVRP